MSDGFTFGVPSGIGDAAWAFAKLWHVRDEIKRIEIADGYPHRTHDFVSAVFPKLTRPEGVDYGPFSYDVILLFEQQNGLSVELGQTPTWEKIQSLRGYSRILLQPNRHLELGRRLEDWLPDLPVNYHFPLAVSEADAKRGRKLLAEALPGNKQPVVAISCASYRGSEAWKTWGRQEWVDTIARIKSEGWTPILIGGFWDDLTATVGDETETPCLVGKTGIGATIEQLGLFDAYIGFSSGLNVMRTILNKPAFALWPDFQAELMYSHAPPAMIEEDRYVARLWRPVEEVWPSMRVFLRRCADERDQAKRPSLVA